MFYMTAVVSYTLTVSERILLSMLSFILAKKIFSMLLMVLCGAIMVKAGVVSSKDSKVLSVLMLYLVMPLGIFSPFLVENTAAVRRGILLTVVVSVFIHIGMILLVTLLSKPFHLKPTDRNSVIFSNSGNLLLPLISSVLGDEWEIYTIGFIMVQVFFVWTYGIMVMSGERKINWRKILINPNFISIYIGLFFFFTGMRFPAPVQDAVSSVGSMIGPMAMLGVGMLLPSVKWKLLIREKRSWIVIGLRLIIVPLLCILVCKALHVADLVENGEMILLVTLMAAMAPVAATVTQLAQVYDQDGDYAGAINVVTTLLCIITMPLMVAVYQL